MRLIVHENLGQGQEVMRLIVHENLGPNSSIKAIIEMRQVV